MTVIAEGYDSLAVTCTYTWNTCMYVKELSSTDPARSTRWSLAFLIVSEPGSREEM